LADDQTPIPSTLGRFELVRSVAIRWATERDFAVQFGGHLNRIIEALADDLGAIFVPLPKQGSANMLSAVNNFSYMSKEFGALIEEVAGDLADGVIATTEFKRIEKEAVKLR